MSCCSHAHHPETHDEQVRTSHITHGAHLIVMAAIVIFVPFLISRLSRPVAITVPVTVPTTPQANTSAQIIRSVSEGGVDADVLSITRADEKTVIRLAFNNHQYNLADPELASRTTFDGTLPSEWRILSSGSGGHHAEVEAVFSGEIAGDLTLNIIDSLTLTFPDL